MMTIPLTVNLTRVGTLWRVNGDHIRTMPPVKPGDPHFDVRMPDGFITDLDSVPRVPIFYSWLKNRTVAAAAWHDYLCSAGYPLAWADAMFLQDMKAEGVKNRYRKPIYWGVRIFGAAYHKHKKSIPWWRKHLDDVQNEKLTVYRAVDYAESTKNTVARKHLDNIKGAAPWNAEKNKN